MVCGIEVESNISIQKYSVHLCATLQRQELSSNILELYLELYIIRFLFAEYFGSYHLYPFIINNNNSERYLFSELQWDAGTF